MKILQAVLSRVLIRFRSVIMLLYFCIMLPLPDLFQPPENEGGIDAAEAEGVG